MAPASKHPYVVSIPSPGPGDDPRSRSLKGACPQNNTPCCVAKGAKLLSDNHTGIEEALTFIPSSLAGKEREELWLAAFGRHVSGVGNQGFWVEGLGLRDLGFGD